MKLNPILAVFIAQVFFTGADALQKSILKGKGFSVQTLLNIKFLLTIPVAGIGFVFLMYALSKMDVSRTIILLSVCGVVMAALAGVVFFGDKLAMKNYVGIVFAIAAIVLVNAK
jgi:multidrug transporter EmrE-like cation transporter